MRQKRSLMYRPESKFILCTVFLIQICTIFIILSRKKGLLTHKRVPWVGKLNRISLFQVHSPGINKSTAGEKKCEDEKWFLQAIRCPDENSFIHCSFQIINLSFSVSCPCALFLFASSRANGESKLFQSRKILLFNFLLLWNLFALNFGSNWTLGGQRRRCQVKPANDRGKAGVKGEKRSAGD